MPAWQRETFLQLSAEIRLCNGKMEVVTGSWHCSIFRQMPFMSRSKKNLTVHVVSIFYALSSGAWLASLLFLSVFSEAGASFFFFFFCICEESKVKFG